MSDKRGGRVTMDLDEYDDEDFAVDEAEIQRLEAQQRRLPQRVNFGSGSKDGNASASAAAAAAARRAAISSALGGGGGSGSGSGTASASKGVEGSSINGGGEAGKSSSSRMSAKTPDQGASGSGLWAGRGGSTGGVSGSNRPVAGGKAFKLKGMPSASGIGESSGANLANHRSDKSHGTASGISRTTSGAVTTSKQQMTSNTPSGAIPGASKAPRSTSASGHIGTGNMAPQQRVHDVDMEDSFDDIDFEFDDFAAESLMAIDNLANSHTPTNATAGPSRYSSDFGGSKAHVNSGAAARSASIASILATGTGPSAGPSRPSAYSGSGKSPFPKKQSTLVNATTLSALNAANAQAGPSRQFQRTDSEPSKALPLNAYTFKPTAAAAYQTHLPFRNNAQKEGKTWAKTAFAKTGRQTKLGAGPGGKGKGKSKTKKKGFDPFGGDSDGDDDEEEMEKIDGEEDEELHFDQYPAPFLDPNKPPAPPRHLPLSATTGTYIYPINIPKRDYQYEIIRSCFMDNTLVALPTGLGKTFIAGVVLLNFYRWFPTGKLIFLMPTKPLVTQQHEACQKTCGIPSADAATITGDDPRAWRESTWATKRVIYATPQTFLIDMVKGRLDPLDVVLVIIDEAHKASGNHSYVQCISYLTSRQQNFRVIALSATPGRSTEKVQDIIDNLHISKVEIREAEAPEISKYMFDKAIYQHVLKMSPVIIEISQRWGNMMKPYLQPLIAAELLTERSLNVFGLKAFTVTCLMQKRNLDGKLYGSIKVLSKMALGMGYLLEFSLGMFHQVMLDMLDGGKGSKTQPGKNAKGGIREKPDFKKLLDLVETLRNNKTSIADEHPKLERCRDLLIEHLTQDAEDIETGVQQTPTKCMVFCSYRGAVGEIVSLLNEQHPLIRAHKFVGRSNSANNDGDKGLTQVEQKAVIDQFKKGVYNVLVATSIGEEGLDIGEVDFIILYNCPRESIKMLQRVGRAGRKRSGKIHVFMTEGREDRNWNSANENHREIQAEIICGNNIELYSDVKRLLPDGKWPTCIEQIQEVDEWVSEDKKAGSKRKRASTGKAPAKKKARGEAVPEGAMDGFVFASALTSKGKKPKRAAKHALELSDESEEEALPSLSAAVRGPPASEEVALPEPYKAKPRKSRAMPKGSKGKAGNSRKRAKSSEDEELARELFGEVAVGTGGLQEEDEPSRPALDADLAKKEAGYSQINSSWMLDDSDNEFNPHHIDKSVLARPFKPPSFARSTPAPIRHTPSAGSRPSFSRNMPPPSVPSRVLSTLQLNQSPMTDASPMPARRRKGKAVVCSSSPDTPARSAAARLSTTEGEADSSPAVKPLKRQRVTKPRPQHNFIDFEVGVSDDDGDEDGELEDDSSGEENESDRQFAGHFLPTQAPKGYNQRAAYAAGLGTQAGPGGPAFVDRSHLREAFFAKARRPVFLSQEEVPKEGPSSEYDGSFVCGDDTVEYESDE